MYGLRTSDFKDKSHQGGLLNATASTKEIYSKAKELLHELYNEQVPIRLVGMRVDNLVDKNEMQLSLFDNLNNNKQTKIDEVVDDLKNKYGYDIVNRAGKTKIDKEFGEYKNKK